MGFEDESWFSRFEKSSVRSWAEAGEPLRLVHKEPSKDDPEPKALSCYGLYVAELGESWLTEPERLLGAYELADRVCGVFGCPHYEHLSIPQEVA